MDSRRLAGFFFGEVLDLVLVRVVVRVTDTVSVVGVAISSVVLYPFMLVPIVEPVHPASWFPAHGHHVTGLKSFFELSVSRAHFRKPLRESSRGVPIPLWATLSTPFLSTNSDFS